MGMYTEFHFNVELKQDTAKGVITILEYMLNSDAETPVPELPKHDLFDTDRWRCMLRCDSYYFNADTHSTLRYDDIAKTYFLCIRCNLKNYDDEIEKFIDWIKPSLASYHGEFLGFYRYEETEEPTLIYS